MPDERDRWSFSRSVMAFENTPVLPRYKFHFILNTRKFQESPYYTGWAVRWKSTNYCVCLRYKFHQQYWKTNTTFFNLYFPGNNLDFFRGECFVSLDKEVTLPLLFRAFHVSRLQSRACTFSRVFFRRTKKKERLLAVYHLLASSKTCSLTYLMKVINFGSISCINLTRFLKISLLE